MGQYRNKYHNRKTCGYDSAKEARRAEELRLLQRAGEISDLREQVKFELIPAIYVNADGERIESHEEMPLKPWFIKKHGLWCAERSASYVADFVYRDKAGNTIVEDVKGVRTAEYKIKRKLMFWIKGIRVKEV